ncbi:MAG: ParB/RepB/Spo0J family partition protein [Oscillatoria sp. SIO1A7]|nr:ParB/RepB/Spo0J family partition protein [Oscillatoria sp. SIO1A7]
MVLKQQRVSRTTQPKTFKSNGSKSEERVRSIPLDRLLPSKRQPRCYFDGEAMQRLVASIKENGILQPLLARPIGDKQEMYELVAGERRYRSALQLGLAAVPVTVREMTDAEALQYALVENLQRQDLNPVEETEGILQLLVFRLGCNSADVVSQLYRLENEAKGKITQNVLGKSGKPGKSNNEVDEGEATTTPITQSALGKSNRAIVEEVFAELGQMSWRSFVSSRLPLLKLPGKILEALRQGRIEYTKAKEIAKLESEPEQLALLEEAIANSLTLRQVKKLVGEKKTPKKVGEMQAEIEDVFKKAKKFAAWDNTEKCDKLKSLLAELKLVLAEGN